MLLPPPPHAVGVCFGRRVAALALAVSGLLAVVPALAAEAPAAQATPRRPNIIFIFSDDHATSAISAYGSKLIDTPNIDRIAREGAIFRNCFCTNSICGPSRAVILTGKHCHLNSFPDNRCSPMPRRA